MTHTTTDQPVDIGRLGQLLPGVVIEALGAPPDSTEDTAYIADVPLEHLVDAVATAAPTERWREVLLAAAADIEAVAAGTKLWATIPNADRVLAAAILVAIDAASSQPALVAIDSGRPCMSAREMAAQRRSLRS